MILSCYQKLMRQWRVYCWESTYIHYWDSPVYGNTEFSRCYSSHDFISFNQRVAVSGHHYLATSPVLVTARNESFFTSWEKGKKAKSHPINTTNFYGLRISWRKIGQRYLEANRYVFCQSFFYPNLCRLVFHLLWNFIERQVKFNKFWYSNAYFDISY